MTIQPLLFSKSGICEVEEMYFHHEGKSVSLETFYNSFAIGKWKKYTNITNLFLEIYTPNELSIKAFTAVSEVDNRINSDDVQYINGVKRQWDNPIEKSEYIVTKRREISCSVEKLNTKNVDKSGYCIRFEELPSEGILYIEVSSVSPVVITGGQWCTDAPCVRDDVMISLGICTFKREEFVKKNVNHVISNLIENKESPLYKKIEVFISDNGKSLPQNTFENDSVHLFQNMNAGGAGGFTRTMIEAVHYSKKAFTHIVLMDDDIVLDAAVLERLYYLLCHVREEYKDSMVGGSMFCLEIQKVLYENGGVIGKNVWGSAYHRLWDMSCKDMVSANCVEDDIEYNGWWFCCIPSSVIKRNGLPLPLFIHCDDIEYGKRNSHNSLIILNGINVWHPSLVEWKNPNSIKYYDTRNECILRSLYDDKIFPRKIRLKMAKDSFIRFVSYKYDDIIIDYLALRDYHKGPKHLLSLDPEKNHKRINAYKRVYITPEEAGVSIEGVESGTQYGKRYLITKSALRYLLPARNETKVFIYPDRCLSNGEKRLYFYYPAMGKGFIFQKSVKETFLCLFRVFYIVWVLFICEKNDRKKWKKGMSLLTSLGTWEKYLKLKD